jgi:hypothetical protein
MREDITSLFSFLTFAQLYWAQVSFREPEPWLTYAGNMVTMVKIPESTWIIYKHYKSPMLRLT